MTSHQHEIATSYNRPTVSEEAAKQNRVCIESVANKYCKLKYSCSLCPLRVEEPQTKSVINTMKLVVKTIISIMVLSLVLCCLSECRK